MKQHGIVAIASFADTEADSVASGAGLVRLYLDVALGDKSKELIPGEDDDVMPALPVHIRDPQCP